MTALDQRQEEIMPDAKRSTRGEQTYTLVPNEELLEKLRVAGLEGLELEVSGEGEKKIVIPKFPHGKGCMPFTGMPPCRGSGFYKRKA
jgi:hypothetical protein